MLLRQAGHELRVRRLRAAVPGRGNDGERDGYNDCSVFRIHQFTNSPTHQWFNVALESLLRRTDPARLVGPDRCRDKTPCRPR